VDEMNQLNEDQSWTLYVDEDGVLTLPDELWEALDWGVGDNIEFIEQDDGSFLLIKTDQQEIDVDAEEVVDG
jgi:bifunctional DNA-binding transcriptional regulator/antitoxin component of YhaV-PrlF toxin-antitoxin module